MRSIYARFQQNQEKFPFLSTFVNFGKAVKGQHFSKQVLCRWFNKLVDKDDYDKDDKKRLLEHVWLLTNTVEDDQNLGENCSQNVQNKKAVEFIV